MKQRKVLIEVVLPAGNANKRGRAIIGMRIRLFGALLISVLMLSGCFTQALIRQDFESIKPPISVAWQKTPNLRTPTVAGLVLGPMGVYLDTKSADRMKKEIVVPDMGFEVASRFISIWREKGAAPEMVLLQSPIENDHKFPGASIVFEFLEQPSPVIGADGYFMALCRITMKDNSGKTIHKNQVMFNGFGLDRKRHSLDEFKADNGKLLVEEMKFASQYIADVFVNKLLVELSK
jgi:hypothetical protein